MVGARRVALIKPAGDDLARQLLEDAHELYTEGRADRQPIVSGAALLERLSGLFERVQELRPDADLSSSA
jgi:hypothetical protein